MGAAGEHLEGERACVPEVSHSCHCRRGSLQPCYDVAWGVAKLDRTAWMQRGTLATGPALYRGAVYVDGALRNSVVSELTGEPLGR